MLQQTQVDTVIPYFQKWMARFPTLKDLASSSEQEVLQIWEGLGYYSRARNLLKTARIIVEKFDGVFPDQRAVLVKLPGIGPYTAGAILSIAFGQDQIALDGNIRRVLSRLFNISLPVASKEGLEQLNTIASHALPPGEAGDFNQALMDLGASLCSPSAPDCPVCPLSQHCQSRQLGIQEQRPVLPARRVVPHITVTAAIIRDKENRFLITQRPPNGLLGSLWEFPGGKVEDGEQLENALIREIKEELDAGIDIEEAFGVYNHAYTHFSITLHAFLCRIQNGNSITLKEAQDKRWVNPGEFSQYPMGKIDRRISKKIEERLC